MFADRSPSQARNKPECQIGFAGLQRLGHQVVDPCGFENHARRRLANGGKNLWLASVMQMRNLRVAVAGSNSASISQMYLSECSTSRIGPTRASARVVGNMPSLVRTNSGSPNCCLS